VSSLIFTEIEEAVNKLLLGKGELESVAFNFRLYLSLSKIKNKNDNLIRDTNFSQKELNSKFFKIYNLK